MKKIYLLLFASGMVVAQEEEKVLQSILHEGQENSKVMEHLDHLVNKIGPRLTGSDNLTQACEWTRDQFRAWGLDARLEEWGEFAVGFNRGPWSGKMVQPEERVLTFGTPAWTPGTDGSVTARAVLAPTEEKKIKSKKLKGAWVLQSSRPSREFREKLEAAYAAAGIAGLIRGTRGELVVTTGNHRIAWDKRPKWITIDMVKSDFDLIAGNIRNGKKVKLTFDIRNELKKGPIKLFNVVADLKGVERPDEVVVVGGHLDSWDGARGCVDNGTGCATTMEAARILSQSRAKPRRTIRFMLWSGEEQGLLGSAAYVRKHREKMAQYSAVFVHDGGTNYLSGLPATKEMRPIFEKVFAPVMKLNKEMAFEIDEVDVLTGHQGSDHASFLDAGVPAFFWNQKGRANYDYAHHTQHDNFDQAIPEYQKRSALVVSVGAYGIACQDRLLPRENVATGGDQRPRRMLGVHLDGLVVTAVMENSPAQKAGVQEGDEIVTLDSKEVKDMGALRRAIQVSKKKCVLVVRRDGKLLDVSVTFEN